MGTCKKLYKPIHADTNVAVKQTFADLMGQDTVTAPAALMAGNLSGVAMAAAAA